MSTIFTSSTGNVLVTSTDEDAVCCPRRSSGGARAARVVNYEATVIFICVICIYHQPNMFCRTRGQSVETGRCRRRGREGSRPRG